MEMNIALNQGLVQPMAFTPETKGAEDVAFSVREKDGYFRHTTRSEAVIRFVGIVIILGAFIQWLTPDTNLSGNAQITKLGLSIAFSVIGIGLYTNAVRGYRIELTLDPKKQEIIIARLDRREGVRSKRHIRLRNIKSIYVLKSESLGSPSKMRVRLFDSPTEVTAIRGTYEEIELAHRQLCRSIRQAQS